MRYSPANQAPARPRKSYIPAKWGGGVASTSCAYVFTGMRTPSRPWTRASVTWSHLHGHGNIPSPGTPSTRPARTALTDQAPIQLTQTPTSNDWGAWARRRLAMRRRRRSGAPRSSRPEGGLLRPRARIPEESGQVGLDKSPQTRRRIRRTNDGSRRPPARPGVMHALRRWSTVSLSF